MIDQQEIEARVARGAALLDEKEPGWWEKIRIEELALSSCYRCVIGQLLGNREGSVGFVRGVHKLGISDDYWDFGFAAYCYSGPTDESAPYWAALTAAWKRLIESRRNPVTLPRTQPLAKAVEMCLAK